MTDHRKPHHGRRPDGTREGIPDRALYDDREVVQMRGTLVDRGMEASEDARDVSRLVEENRWGVERLLQPAGRGARPETTPVVPA